MADPYDWPDDLSPENVDKIFDLEVIAEYPLGDSFVLTYFSGRPMEHMVLFDGSNEGVEVRGSMGGNRVRVFNSSGCDVFLLPGTIFYGDFFDMITFLPAVVVHSDDRYYEFVDCYNMMQGRSRDFGIRKYVFRNSMLAPLDVRLMIMSPYVDNDILVEWIDVFSDIVSLISYVPYLPWHREIKIDSSSLLRLMTLFLVCPCQLGYLYRDIFELNSFLCDLLPRSGHSIYMAKNILQDKYRRVEDLDIPSPPASYYSWIDAIKKLCILGVDKFFDSGEIRRELLKSLYGFLHIQNLPSLAGLRPLYRIMVLSFRRNAINIISRYSGIKHNRIRDCLTSDDGVSRLVDLTVNIDGMKNAFKEILELVEELSRRENYDHIELEIENIRHEIDYFSGLMCQLLEQLEAYMKRIMDIRAKLTVKVLPMLLRNKISPTRFGVRYSDNIIGYSLRWNDDLVCVEIFPAYLSKKLWVDLFQSILAYVIYYGQMYGEKKILLLKKLLETIEEKRSQAFVNETYKAFNDETYFVIARDLWPRIETVVKLIDSHPIYYFSGLRSYLWERIIEQREENPFD